MVLCLNVAEGALDIAMLPVWNTTD